MKLIKLVGAGLAVVALTACGDAEPADHTEQVEQAAVVDEIGINNRVAQMMMKVTVEIGNTSTYSQLGLNTLYQIATLPPEAREIEHGIDGLQVGNVIEVISDSDGAFKEVARQ